MPYFRIYSDKVDDYDEGDGDDAAPDPVGPGPRTFYEPAVAAVDFAAAGPFLKGARDAFLLKGFDAVQVSYDGGHDEGFAHFDHAVARGVLFSPDEIITLLTGTGFEEAAVHMYYDERYPADALRQFEERLRAMPVEERMRQAVEEFAQQLATQLLGSGFGTGEYELKGRFHCDLNTGVLTDLEGEPFADEDDAV